MKKYIVFLLLLIHISAFSQDVVKINQEIDSLNNIFNKKSSSVFTRAKGFSDLAQKYYNSREYYKALTYNRQAEKLFISSGLNQEIKKKKELGNIYINLGLASEKLSDNENSMEYFFKAKQIFHELRDYANEADATESIARLYTYNRIYKTGMKYLLIARQFYITDRLKFKRELLLNSYHIGNVFDGLHKSDSAIIWYKTALKYQDNKTDPLQRMHIAIVNNIGSQYYDKNLIDSAYYYYTFALNLLGNSNDDLFLGIINGNIGEIKMKQKHYKEALPYFTKAVKHLTNAKAYDKLVHFYLDLKDYYKEINNYNTSLFYLEKYVKLNDSISSSERLLKLADYDRLNDLRAKEAQIQLIEKDKLLVVKQNKIKTIWQIFLILGFIFFLFLGFLFYRNLRINLKNKMLNEKLLLRDKIQLSTELQLKEKDLETKNIEIKLRQKDLENKNIELQLNQMELENKNIELQLKQKDLENKNIELMLKNKGLEYFALRIVEKNQLIEDIEREIDSLQGTEKDKKQLLKITNTIRNNYIIETEIYDIENKINDSYEGFFKKLEVKHPRLTKSEKRLCSLIVLNLDNKKIATLTNITVESVKKNRNRIRKKLNLIPEDNISSYLKTI